MTVWGWVRYAAFILLVLGMGVGGWYNTMRNRPRRPGQRRWWR